MKNKINLIISNEQDKIEITDEVEDLINKVIGKVCEIENINMDIEVSVLFTDNDSIKKINYEFRKKDMPTDVLSFPQLEFEEKGIIKVYEKDDYPYIMLGDIVISMERALEQAKMYGHSFIREVAFLTSHSMYHLLGYDHIEKNDEDEMKEKQEKVLVELGILR